jgi:proteasome lid subunit RPN8/RPN11
MELYLTEEAKNTIHTHALDTFPNECCGFFYGRDDEHRRFIELAVPVENSKEGDQRRRFEISPFDYMKAEQKAIELGLDLLGIYHSHPLHPAIPSIHDLKQAVPVFSYIIVSVNEDEVADTRSWILNEHGEFEEEKIYNVKKQVEIIS